MIKGKKLRVVGIPIFTATFFLILFSCSRRQENFRSVIDLSGQWQFSLDSADIGIKQQWFSGELEDVVTLPGTTDINKKGYKSTDTTTLHLNRLYKYEGPAWYKKKITIPQEWEGKHITLLMERTKPSKVWVDDQYIGESFLLESPQKYDLSEVLQPGKHTITVRIDNNLKLTPFGNVHIYTDETQTNWNGIIGDFYLEASEKTYIEDLQVFPDVDSKKAKVRLTIDNQLKLDEIDIELGVIKKIDGETTQLKAVKFSLPCDSVIEVEYEFGEDMDLWDEYYRPLYELNAKISGKDGVRDNVTVPFGMRTFEVAGTQFAVNGQKTFLRGKHDACVFPLTGHPPMDVEGWMRAFEIAKSYGINHCRFHSWCPPEAAFDAADRLGIYLQPELPFWGGLESDTIADMLKREGVALLSSYANHPSFVMFSPGNEIWGGHQRVEKLITELKELDGRPLYTQGSNNSIGFVGPMNNTDFHIAARTPHDGDTILTHTRLTHAFADSRDGGILNTKLPSSVVNFDYPVAQIDMPLISHEIGQYQIYPDYAEIDKYTGVVRAWNLEVFRNRLKKAGMADLDSAFQKASGAWSALCYKAEMEAAFRTEGFAGFQLLDLQDFPGQGTALVGILDAFMDSKNVISREEWLQSCNDVVLLLEFPKYCWTNKESFQAELKVANYSNQVLTQDLNWEIKNQHGETLHKDSFSNLSIENGGITTIGEINFNLSAIVKAEKLTVNISQGNNRYSNSYPVWVYPADAEVDNSDVVIANKLDAGTIAKLQKGGKVLLFPTAEDVKGKSVPGLFPPDFWNYGMFKGISEWAKKPVSPGTLGILTDPEHPVFNAFPTDFHTNWQWFSIVKASNVLILDSTAHEYRPIVQVIDNMERNHKLGLIFEFKVGEGKLLVCMSQLDKIQDRPEAAQLYSSILNYMKSDQFNPGYEVSEEELKGLL